MHPNNPYYNNPPDFDDLAKQFPSFRPFVNHTVAGKPCIDFKDAAALRELTQCLLKRDFNLDVDLPEDRLCPTLANRLDYLYHLLDIFTYLEGGTAKQRLQVLDIGTGASAIYAILLARIRKESQIWATGMIPYAASRSPAHPILDGILLELNEASFQSAARTLEANNLLPPRINVTKVGTEETPLLAPIATINLEKGDSPFTFSLCNPPFYESVQEIQASTSLKALPTHAAPTAAANELITTGGEVAFIGRMISESVETREKCLWYTSLIGKASSIQPLVDKLKAQNIDNYILLGMRQAHTTRWIIGWSFTDTRLPDSITRTAFPSITKYLPPPNTWTYRPLERSQKPLSAGDVSDIVTTALRAAGIDVESEDDNARSDPGDRLASGEGRIRNHSRKWVIAPTAVTWTRAARRTRTQGSLSDPPRTPLFDACIRVESVKTTETDARRGTPPVGNDGGEVTDDVVVALDWLKGRDRKIVDGLWAFLVRKISDAVRTA